MNAGYSRCWPSVKAFVTIRSSNPIRNWVGAIAFLLGAFERNNEEPGMSILELASHTADFGAARNAWTKGLTALRKFEWLTADQDAEIKVTAPSSIDPTRTSSDADFGVPKPHMADDELALLKSLLSGATHILEYGCGGSTVLAASTKDLRVFSVESDPAWLRKVEAHSAIKIASAMGRVSLNYVNIGPTKKWGKPLNEDCRHNWPLYSSLPWLKQSDYDLIFVDGRFRVACILHSVLRAGRDALIVVHDFWNRPDYHVVLPFLDWRQSCRTLGVFQRRREVDKACVDSLIEKYQYKIA